MAHGSPIFLNVNVGESTVFAKYLFLRIQLFRRIVSDGDVPSTEVGTITCIVKVVTWPFLSDGLSTSEIPPSCCPWNFQGGGGPLQEGLCPELGV